jgi:hypothetical protein
VKWIFKVKLNPDDTISKHKARLVTRFLEKFDVDYTKVFAPVARIETVRLIVFWLCVLVSKKITKQKPLGFP